MLCIMSETWIGVVAATIGALLAVLVLQKWSIEGRVHSFREATKKRLPDLDTDGNQVPVLDEDGKPGPRYSEIDPEEALRLILDHRMKTATLLLAFASLIAILTTVVIVSLAQKEKPPVDGQKQNSLQPATWTVTSSFSTNAASPAAPAEPQQ